MLTMLVLVLVPREVNRVIRAQVAALPTPLDTADLLAQIASRRLAHQNAEASLRAARRADSALVAMLARAATPLDTVGNVATAVSDPVERSEVSRDAERADLQQRINRARVAPLVESYRQLGRSSLLQADARVRPIIDSLEQVDREREAFAALGGPDARYAALSARMNALGQRLLRLAEGQLERTTSRDSAARADDAGQLGIPTPAIARRNPEELQRLATEAAAAQQQVQRAEQDLADARTFNMELEAQRQATMARADIRIPAAASLVAALVIGIVIGYAGAFLLELRTPRLADGAEVEHIAGSRVIVHGKATADVHSARTRRSADRALPPVLDTTSESYHLLHLTLTGLGEVARRVRVLGDSPTLTATVAANLAAAAAREARAVLLVDLDFRNRLVAPLLRVNDRRGMSEVISGDAEVLEVLRDFPVGRDVYMTVLYGGQKTPRAHTPERRMVVHEDLERLAARYDLTVVVGDDGSPAGRALLPAHDVILCTRIGVTPNSWLAHSAQQVRSGAQRVRATLAWTRGTRI